MNKPFWARGVSELMCVVWCLRVFEIIFVVCVGFVCDCLSWGWLASLVWFVVFFSACGVGVCCLVFVFVVFVLFLLGGWRKVVCDCVVVCVGGLVFGFVV